MKKTIALLVALSALLLPSAALAAPTEGAGTITVAPDPLVVPATTVGYQGEWLTVDISYEGEGEAVVDKVVLSGGETSEFSSDGSTCSVLQSGEHCTARFALKPTTLGEKQATIEITFQGTRPAEQRPISGSSVPAQLSFDPAAYDFGIQRANRDNANGMLQVTNSGEAPVQVFNLEIQGDTSVFSYGPHNCSALLAPGQSCSVQIYFSPHDQVEYLGELRAYTGGGDFFSAALSGRGGRAVIGPATNPVGFGALAVGTSLVKTITLTNSGDLPAAFFIAVIAGGDVGSFRLLSENCTMVALEPAASCSVRVRFEPQEAGPLSARFALFGDDEPTMVLLEGEGVASASAPTAVSASAQAAQQVAQPPATARKPRNKRFGRNKSIHAVSVKARHHRDLRARATR